MCGFGFKGERYRHHWDTLVENNKSQCVGLPDLQADFLYIGVNDPPPYLLEGPGGSRAGEAKTLDDFKLDPLAESEPLVSKEQSRDRTHRHHPYSVCRQ